MSNVNDILKQFNKFSKSELSKISAHLLQLLHSANEVEAVANITVEKCRKCGNEHIVKFGKDKNGKQRYRCKSCGASFTETSYSVVTNTHKTMDVWEKYIEALLEGASLEKCAQKCGISVRTAFIWRHKILNAMQKDQDNRCLCGIIEADELYVAVSYKGNHKKSKRFTMPRKAFRRGSDNTSMMGSKACVIYAVERNGQTYGECLGIGQMDTAKVALAFDKRVMPESIMISDGARCYKTHYDMVDTVELIQLKAHPYGNNTKVPTIKGAYHIQTVNNLHSRFRRFMRAYNGVATKYLNHYVGMFIWMENYRRANGTCINEYAREYICGANTYISREDIFSMPPAPNPIAA